MKAKAYGISFDKNIRRVLERGCSSRRVAKPLSRWDSRNLRLPRQPLAQDRRRPLLHFVGRLVREGDGEDAVRRCAATDQLGDAIGDHPGLARPRAGQHQQRPGKGMNGFGLGGIQNPSILDRTRPGAAAKGGLGTGPIPAGTAILAKRRLRRHNKDGPSIRGAKAGAP